MIYTGKQNPTNSLGLGHSPTVIMQLLEDLFGRYRTVVAGNCLRVLLSRQMIPTSLKR